VSGPAAAPVDASVDGHVRERALIRTEKARRHLREFVREAWHVVEPSTPFVPGWHLDAICEHLEAVRAGQLRNLLINIPPRHMKSLAVSVFWPTWEWLTRPSLRWLFASYALPLSVRDSLKCRRLIESPWYRRHWGDVYRLTSDQNAKVRFENDKTGFRVATSVGGLATGEGGDRLVVDDPHSIQEADSDVVREGALTWWDEVMATRGNDPRTVARVIVMQRTHERDLSGHVLERGGYHHLCLPARYEPRIVSAPHSAVLTPPAMLTPPPAPHSRLPRTADIPLSYGSGARGEVSDPAPHDDCPVAVDPRTEPGELLWPARFGEVELAQLERDLGPYAAAGQLQQRPVPRMGAIFNAQDVKPLPAGFETRRGQLNVVQFYDLAWSEKETADYTAGVTVGLDPRTQELFILHVWRQRIGEERLDEALAEQIAQHGPALVGVELGAYRQAATRDLVRRLNRLLSARRVATVITAVSVSTDKGFRAQLPAGRAQAGFVFGDKRATWWPAFETELLRFPRGAHDDQVDAYAGAVQLAIERGRPRTRSAVQMVFGDGQAPPPESSKPDDPASYLARRVAEGWPGEPDTPWFKLPEPD
jgi:predicted phage terminase large subunit-like protein